jgi:hypothetical protein
MNPSDRAYLYPFSKQSISGSKHNPARTNIANESKDINLFWQSINIKKSQQYRAWIETWVLRLEQELRNQ